MFTQKEKVQFGFALVAVLSLAYAAFQYGQSVNDAYSTRTFTVEGKAEIQNANDVANFTATVLTEGGLDQAEVQNRNAEAMNRVVSYLESKNIAKEDIQTENYTLNPRYSNPSCFGGRCEESQIIGHTASQNVVVKVRDVALAGELVSGVVQNGATSVSQATFSVDDNREALQEARIAALRDAQEQANELAEAGDFRLGKMITFYEQGNPIEPYAVGGDLAMMEKSVSQAVNPNLQPGSTEGQVRLTVTYEIK